MFKSLDEIQQEVIKRLKEQGCRGTESDGEGCHYRTSNGMKCAVGVLIPDDLYNPNMEGYQVSTLFAEHTELHSLFAPEILEEAINLLEHLQALHDYQSDFNDMISKMEAF